MHTKAHTKKNSNKNPNAQLSEGTDGGLKTEQRERREKRMSATKCARTKLGFGDCTGTPPRARRRPPARVSLTHFHGCDCSPRFLDAGHRPMLQGDVGQASRGGQK
jgi:hypothetical protein